MDTGPAPVVVGVDGSPESRGAARLGAFEARSRGTGLELLLVLPRGPARRPPAEEGLDGMRMVRAAAALLLDATADDVARHVPEVPITTHVVDGRPADVLADAARRADLVLVGSRSSGVLGDAVLGSTAMAVLRSSPCPVLVVPLRPAATIYDRRGVVVGVAGGPGDQAVLSFAFAAAASRATDLLAVHTWRHPFPGVGHLLLDPFVDDAAAQRREEGVLADALESRAGRTPGVEVRQVIERERPAAALVAASLTADLVVVGHRRRPAGLVGSVTAAVVHRADCPVAVVPLPVPEPAAVSPAARS